MKIKSLQIQYPHVEQTKYNIIWSTYNTTKKPKPFQTSKNGTAALLDERISFFVDESIEKYVVRTVLVDVCDHVCEALRHRLSRQHALRLQLLHQLLLCVDRASRHDAVTESSTKPDNIQRRNHTVACYATLELN